MLAGAHHFAAIGTTAHSSSLPPPLPLRAGGHVLYSCGPVAGGKNNVTEELFQATGCTGASNRNESFVADGSCVAFGNRLSRQVRRLGAILYAFLLKEYSFRAVL